LIQSFRQPVKVIHVEEVSHIFYVQLLDTNTLLTRVRPHWWQHSHDYLNLQKAIAFNEIRVQSLLERDSQLSNMLRQAFGSGR
jgi:hypothetical protein